MPKQDLLKCPFCGFRPDRSDIDCVYPVDRERTVYNVVCYETGGGCGASVLGSNADDAIKKWNTRNEL